MKKYLPLVSRFCYALIILMAPLFTYSQDVLTIDMETNTIRRLEVTNGEKIRDPNEREKLMKQYLEKESNDYWTLVKQDYKKPLRKQLRVGDYLIFEMTNIDKRNNAKVDSVFVSYNFLDRNVQQYKSTFGNILNSNLEQFNTESSLSLIHI